MTPSIFKRGLLVSAVTLLARLATAQEPTTASAAPGAITTLGCYSNVGNLDLQSSYTYQTSGYCQTQCAGLNKPVMAITQGSTCYCGDSLPSNDYSASNSSCNSPCNGYSLEMCGGIGFWTVYLDGLSQVLVSTAAGRSSTANPTLSPTAKTSSPAVVTKPGETVVVTASASPSSPGSSSSSGGGSKIGVAVGVVVGVIVMAAIVIGAWWVLKNRRRKAIEEEHRRNAAVNQFVGGKVERSAADQRLDVSQTNKFRRQSIGSIADENDFSRRILQVRNPDSNRSSAISKLDQHV